MKRITTGKHVVEWVAKATNEFGNFGCAVGIGLQEYVGPHWKLIAGVAYNEYNGVNLCAHIASDGSKLWANREFLWAIFDYPFNQAKVQRLTVMVGQGNKNSVRFVEHLGFQFETFLKDAHPSGNLLIYYARKPHVQRWLDVRSSRESMDEKHLALAA